MQWAESGVLSLSALPHLHPEELIVKSSSDKRFMYAELGVSDRLNDSGLGSQTELVSMKPVDFVEACRQQRLGGPGPFVYLTKVLSELSPMLARGAMAGWTELIPDRVANERGGSFASTWFGGAGSTTQAHYDVQHNVFCQLEGEKRFRLWSPEHHLAMHLFPDVGTFLLCDLQMPRISWRDPMTSALLTQILMQAHPRARKAQAPVGISGETGGKQFPLLPGLPEPELDVIMQPGDALFIPSFWFHHVEALGPSTSVNVFSESAVKQHAQTILGREPPMHLLDHAGDPATLLGDAVTALVRAVPDLPINLIDRIVKSRYHPQSLSNPPVAPPSALSEQEDTVPQAGQIDWSKFLNPNFCEDFVPPPGPPINVDADADVAEALVPLFSALGDRGLLKSGGPERGISELGKYPLRLSAVVLNSLIFPLCISGSASS